MNMNIKFIFIIDLVGIGWMLSMCEEIGKMLNWLLIIM